MRVVLAASCGATLLLGFAGHAVAAGAVANPDSATTSQDTPVNIDVLANDSVPLPLVLASPAIVIESDPQHGTATVNPDGKTIHYVPDAGYTGPDAMEYDICTVFGGQSEAVGPAGAGAVCAATGDVSITVTGVAPTTSTTEPATTTTVEPLAVTSTTAASTTTTVAAAAATNELPHTGSGSTPLGIAGIVAVAAGGAAILASRRGRQRP